MFFTNSHLFKFYFFKSLFICFLVSTSYDIPLSFLRGLDCILSILFSYKIPIVVRSLREYHIYIT